MGDYLLTFADCAGHETNRSAAVAFIRRVTGADVTFERFPEKPTIWVAPLPPGWIFVATNHGPGHQLGWWSSEFFQISTEDDFEVDDSMRPLYAPYHTEKLPDDWKAPNNLWACIHRYALIPRERIDLVPMLLDPKNVGDALALPDGSRANGP